MLQWGWCSQPPSTAAGVRGEEVFSIRENHLWGTMTLPSNLPAYGPPGGALTDVLISVCAIGSGVLWGALQSGSEWGGVSSQSSGHTHSPAQLPGHREVPPSSWQRGQRKWRSLHYHNIARPFFPLFLLIFFFSQLQNYWHPIIKKNNHLT